MIRLIFILLCTPALGAQLGIDDAKRFAAEHNYEVVALKSELAQREAETRRVRASFFPTLGVAGGTDTDISAKRNESVGIGFVYAKYNLFNGFADTYRAQIAGVESDAVRVRYERTKFRVGLEIESQFYLYLLKKTAIDIKREALEQNEGARRAASQRHGSGLAAESDVMEFSLRDALLRSDVAGLEQEIEEARVNLRRLLGDEIGGAVEPTGNLQDLHIKGTLMDFVGRIEKESEPVQLAARELARATVESKQWRSRWMPTIDIEAQAGYLDLLNRPPDGGAALRGGIIARFEIFSGLSSYAERAAGEASRLRREAELKQAILRSVSQMEIAYRKIKAIEERVHLENENTQRARRYLASVTGEYRRGVKNSADVRQANEILVEARLRRENYKYAFITQKIEIERSLGAAVPVEIDPDH